MRRASGAAPAPWDTGFAGSAFMQPAQPTQPQPAPQDDFAWFIATWQATHQHAFGLGLLEEMRAPKLDNGGRSSVKNYRLLVQEALRYGKPWTFGELASWAVSQGYEGAALKAGYVTGETAAFNKVATMLKRHAWSAAWAMGTAGRPRGLLGALSAHAKESSEIFLSAWAALDRANGPLTVEELKTKSKVLKDAGDETLKDVMTEWHKGRLVHPVEYR